MMKEIAELEVPENLRYAKDHEWAGKADGKMRVGISDYAQDQLGDIVFVELPQVGRTLSKGEQFGTVESVKAVAELFMPLAGRILAVNNVLEESPEIVNRDPYKEGWMIEVNPSDPSELESLMTKENYLQMLKGLK
jgi:glycine cleavage system H protein